MDLHLDCLTIEAIIKKLDESGLAKQKLQNKFNVYEVKMEQDGISAHIEAFQFAYGLQLLLIKTNKNTEDINLITDCGNDHPAIFNFTITGGVAHNFGPFEETYKSIPLTGAISICPTSCDQTITLEKGKESDLCMILIDRESYRRWFETNFDEVNGKIADLFKLDELERPTIYYGNFSLAIAEAIQEIRNAPYDGIIRSIHAEARTLEILMLQLHQYREDKTVQAGQIALKDYDVEQLKAANDILKNNILNPPNIPDLARQVGLNQNKLKRGFKLLFNKTVGESIRTFRLEAAKEMMDKTEMSIQEISYKVGYINQGYFSKRFRQKYGLLPKNYIKGLKKLRSGEA